MIPDRSVNRTQAQRTGKSTGLQYLYGERFFIDHLPDFHSKDSFQQLQGAWCVEVAEMSAMTKAEVHDVKQFLSRAVDKFRPPYGKMPIMVPRRCVFGGSINPEEGGYLRDPTGARRFWPVATQTIDLEGILRDRDLIWAEAVLRFQAGDPWYLTDQNEIDLAKEQQDARREIDPWEALLLTYADEKSCTAITIENALRNVAFVPADRLNQTLRRRMGNALRNIGWVGGKPERLQGVKNPVRVFRDPDHIPVEPKQEAFLPPEDDGLLNKDWE